MLGLGCQRSGLGRTFCARYSMPPDAQAWGTAAEISCFKTRLEDMIMSIMNLDQ